LRSYEEIKTELDSAVLINDSGIARSLVEELQSLRSPRAEATALNTLGKMYWTTGHYPQALEHYRKALPMLEDLGDRAGIASVERDMGIVFWSTGDYPQALECYRRALHMFEELGDKAGAARVTGNMGIVYRSIGDYPKALDSYRRSLEVHEHLGDRTSAARVMVGLGNLYYHTGDYPLALEHYHKALHLHEEVGDRASAAHAIGNLGIVYMSTGDYPKAMEHYRRALHLHEQVGDRAGAAGVTGNMGLVYFNTGDHQKALEYYQNALPLHQELGNRPSTAIVTGNIGNVYRITGDYPQALEHFRQALQMHEEVGNAASAAIVTGNMAAVLLQMDRDEDAEELLLKQSTMVMDRPDARAEHHSNKAVLAEHKGDLDAAWNQLQQALEVVIEAGDRELAAACHQKLRDLAQKRNDFDGYIAHNNEYMRITEEVKGRETTKRLTVMEAERKMESVWRERDKERALLYSALPETVANRMLRGEDVSGDHVESASVLFLDIAGFTTISDQISPGHVVDLLKGIFKICDNVCTRNGLTKIKTIGDSYMAVAGVPDPLDDHAHRAAQAALEMHAAFSRPLHAYLEELPPGLPEILNIRIGLHCGPLVAGIVGEERLQYDVWGDTVNTASRMESTGEPGRIQVSEAFAEGLGSRGDGQENTTADASLAPRPFTLAPRGAIEIKGKGTMTTYWLEPAE